MIHVHKSWHLLTMLWMSSVYRGQIWLHPPCMCSTVASYQLTLQVPEACRSSGLAGQASISKAAHSSPDSVPEALAKNLTTPDSKVLPSKPPFALLLGSSCTSTAKQECHYVAIFSGRCLTRLHSRSAGRPEQCRLRCLLRLSCTTDRVNFSTQNAHCCNATYVMYQLENQRTFKQRPFCPFVMCGIISVCHIVGNVTTQKALLHLHL